jgi:hypothetical protein
MERTARAVACALSLAACARGGAVEGPVAPPRPAPQADPACRHDAAIEAEVRTELEREVREDVSDPEARVDVSFECPRLAAPRWWVGLRAHGHGGSLEVLGAHAVAEDQVEVTTLVLRPRQTVSVLTDPAPAVDVRHASASGDRARGVLARARAALAARVAVVAPAPADGSLRLSTVASTDNEEIDLRTRGPRFDRLSRQWQGYGGTESRPEVAPIELAFQALWDVASGAAPATAGEADRQLLAEAWAAPMPHAWWTRQGLLDMASVVGSAPVLPDILASLMGPNESEQVLAVRALAAITGRDHVHDARGTVRPLAAIVADCRAQFPDAR